MKRTFLLRFSGDEKGLALSIRDERETVHGIVAIKEKQTNEGIVYSFVYTKQKKGSSNFVTNFLGPSKMEVEFVSLKKFVESELISIGFRPFQVKDFVRSCDHVVGENHPSLFNRRYYLLFKEYIQSGAAPTSMKDE